MTDVACFSSSFRYPLFTKGKKPLPLRFLAYSEPQLIFCLRICGNLFHHGKHRFPISYFAASSYLFLEVFCVVFVPIMITFSAIVVVVVVVVLGFPLSRPFLLQSVFSGCSEEHFLPVLKKNSIILLLLPSFF